MRLQSSLLASGAFLALWTSLPSQVQQTFRSGVSAIPIYATVRNSSGALVPDLTRDDFAIKDNGVTREITIFSREIVPITVTVLLDMSGSQEHGVMWMRDAGRAFVDALLPADRARIGSFGAEIAISPRLTGDKKYLHRVLNEEIWPGGTTTPLWQAIDRATTSLADQPGRRVVLTLTDGIDWTGIGGSGALVSTSVDPMAAVGLPDASSDTSGRTGSFGGGFPPPARLRGPTATGSDPPLELSARIAREGFMIYAAARVAESRILPGGSLSAPTSLDALSLAMQNVAVDSGGGYRIFSTTADAGAAMRQVADELHHQYLLGFIPEVLDGQLHKLEVTTRRGGMSVQARKTYLAVAP